MDDAAKERLRACCRDEEAFHQAMGLFAATYHGCGDCKQRFRLLFDHAPIGIAVADRGHQVLAANQALATMLDRPRCDIEAGTLLDLDRPEDRQASTEVLDALWRQAPETIRLSRRYHRNDGSEVWGNTIYASACDDDAAPLLTIVMVEDETALRTAEAETARQRHRLLQAEKMAALGTLVSGVAHEINNPTNIITMNLARMRQIWQDAGALFDDYHQENGDFLLGGLEYSSAHTLLSGMFQAIDQAAERIGTIVRDLLAYGRPAAEDHVDGVNLNTVARNALSAVQRPLDHHGGEMVVDLDDTIPVVRGSQRRLEQVVVNLLLNACHACDDTQAAIRLHTGHHADTHVMLAVSDAGHGMSADILARIGEPFFTTKRGAGTGLGLWMSKTIIEEHDGDMTIDSAPGRGTTITVLLPIQEPAR